MRVKQTQKLKGDRNSDTRHVETLKIDIEDPKEKKKTRDVFGGKEKGNEAQKPKFVVRRRPLHL